MVGAIIETMSEAEQLQFQLESIELKLTHFAISVVTELANKLIIDVIHQKMRAANYSQKIINRTFLAGVEIKKGTNGNQAFIHIISDYESENKFDVAKMMEQGRKKYRVEPKISQQKKTSVGGLSDHSEPQALAFFVNGKLVFSKGHTIPAKKGSKIIANTMSNQANKVEEQFHQRQLRFIKQNITDGNNIVLNN